MLPDATRCYWMLPDATRCYRMLLGATRYYWVLLGATGYYLVLMSANGCYWVLLGATWCYWVLLGVTGCYQVLPGVTGHECFGFFLITVTYIESIISVMSPSHISRCVSLLCWLVEWLINQEKSHQSLSRTFTNAFLSAMVTSGKNKCIKCILKMLHD